VVPRLKVQSVSAAHNTTQKIDGDIGLHFTIDVHTMTASSPTIDNSYSSSIGWSKMDAVGILLLKHLRR